MVKINTDLIFIDTSGQVRSTDGDLVLRADDTGTNDIIVGSGRSLRPEADCRSFERIDLGLEFLRWGTLFACSGNFIDRPTVNGSGVLLQGEAGGAAAGVDSIEALTGVVDLDSPDESININVNVQTIELTTPGSGAPSGASYILVDYNDNDHLTDARRLTATSGIILDDQGARSVSGMVVKLDFDNEPTVNQILSWDGFKLKWVDDETGGGGGAGGVEKFFTPTSGTIFVVEHGLNTTAFVWSMWLTHENEQDLDPIESMEPKNVAPSGNNHAIISIDDPVSGVVTFVG